MDCGGDSFLAHRRLPNGRRDGFLAEIVLDDDSHPAMWEVTYCERGPNLGRTVRLRTLRLAKRTVARLAREADGQRRSS